MKRRGKRRRRPAVGFFKKKIKGEEKTIPRTAPIGYGAPPYRIKAYQPRKPTKEAVLSASRYAAVMEISRYLAGYLSHDNTTQVFVSPDNNFSATRAPGKPIIFLPHWQRYEIPVQGVNKWRIYRNGEWHETQHIKHTPEGIYYLGRNDPVEKDVVNIIEDRRIEDLGIDYHQGYLPELLYSHAYGTAMRPNVEELWKIAERWKRQGNPSEAEKYEIMAKREAFIQKTIAHQQKGKLPPRIQAEIDDAVDLVERRLEELKKKNYDPHSYADGKAITDAVEGLSATVIRRLKLRASDSAAQPPAMKNWDHSFTSQQAQFAKGGKSKKEQRREVEKHMEGFFEAEKKKAEKAGRKKREDPKAGEGAQKDAGKVHADDVDKAKSGDASIIKEFENIQQAKGFERPPDLSYSWKPLPHVRPPEEFRDLKFIKEMKARLKEWRLGRHVEAAKTGHMVSVSGFVRTGGKKPFRRIERKSVKGQKYLFVLDFSGSMHPRQDEYKKALISTLEPLDDIGSKMAVFVFGGAPDPSAPDDANKAKDGYYRVKTFEGGRKWTNSDSGRVAALLASLPSTPLGRCYTELETYIKKHRPDKTITITDGGPSNRMRATGMIKDLKKHTKMVAFGIADGPSDHQVMVRNFKDLGYDKGFVVEDVNEIPPKLIGMIAPTPTRR